MAKVKGKVRLAGRRRSANLEEIAMKEINGSSEEISEMVRVIDETEFQANILSLNAVMARESAASVGFAMVAHEIRNLTQSFAQAAKTTALPIERSIVESVVKSVVRGASQNQVRGFQRTPASTADMELAPYCKSLLALSDRLRRLSGANSAPEPACPVAMPRRPALELEEDEALS